MKKFIAIVFAVCSFNLAQAQQLKSIEVPATVHSSFKKLYPTIKNVKWAKEGSNFEAEFDLGKIETTVVFDGNGSMVQTESEIKISELPTEATNYIATNLAGKKIKEAAKIVDVKGVITYEAEIEKVDYIFDVTGKFLHKGN